MSRSASPSRGQSRSPSPPRLDNEKNFETKTRVGDATRSDFDAEVAAAAPRLRGPALTAAIAFVAGTGFTLFGYVIMFRTHSENGISLPVTARYDQGVMSALLSAKQFEKVFPQVITGDGQPASHATLQSFVVAIYVSTSLPTARVRSYRVRQTNGISRKSAASSVPCQTSG